MERLHYRMQAKSPMVFHFAEPGKIFITNALMQRPCYGGKGGAEDKLGGEPQNNELPPYPFNPLAPSSL
jgi:hypothetical protein